MKMTLKQIALGLANGISADAIRIVKGELRVYRGFYYRPKESTEEWMERMRSDITACGVHVDLLGYDREDYIPFKGDAPVWKQNHDVARFRVVSVNE